jgi:hypothetical protein
MRSDWKGFERLAERIARDLRPDAIITWDDHLPGRISETTRQIDVSFRWSDADREYLTIVQAKDWGTPADVNAVGAFAAVVEDVAATRGVMVCRSGFTQTAKTYARNKGIELYNLHDAESRDWRLELTIPLLWIDLYPSAEFPCNVYLDKGEQYAVEDGFLVLHIPGGPRIHPATVFEQLWNQRAIPDTAGVRHTIQPGGVARRRPPGGVRGRPPGLARPVHPQPVPRPGRLPRQRRLHRLPPADRGDPHRTQRPVGRDR